MTTKPRKLKLLIIDDELATSPGGYDVPERLERLSPTEGVPGIDSWRTAMRFWYAFKGGDVPDVVVADVRFIRDLDSPLSNLFKAEENNIPTGLSHLKTFAVLSRAIGQPMGVAIRTMDPKLWERQMKSFRAEERAMGFLAVQEIGELASILGDGDELINGVFDKQRAIDKCIIWFKKTSANTFEDGLKHAIADYRRHLLDLATADEVPVLFVRPSYYAQLMGWCKYMSENMQPLDDEHDFGLELTHRDGRRDLISIASLFSDFAGISTKTLDESTFATADAEYSWMFDDDGRPQIGAFLRALGSLNDACGDAAEAVLSYNVSYPPPTNYAPPTLATIKERYSTLTAGLVVLFQFIKIEQKRAELWENSFIDASWDAKRLQFVIGGKNPQNTLKTALLRLISLARNYLAQVGVDEAGAVDDGVKLFTRTELFDEYPEEWVKPINLDDDVREQDSDWVKWHFERLVDGNIFTCTVKHGEEHYEIAPEWRVRRHDLSVPPVPRHFPEMVEISPVKKVSREPERIRWLRETLGYGGDFNSIERVLAAAFSPSSFTKDAVKRGGAILDELKSTNLRPFLLEVAREYAATYLKWPAAKWPTWLQSASQPLNDDVNDEGMLCV